MMRERGLSVDQSTISRWVQHYAPELEKRCRPHVKETMDSWRVDETYIKVKKEWVYLYRAVDSASAPRSISSSARPEMRHSTKPFLLKTLAASHTREPRALNVDKNAAYPQAEALLKAEGHVPENCELAPA